PVVSDFKILKNAGVQEKESFHPLRWFSLEQNYPNPFNPTTTIRFKLPNRERVWLAVYNSLGEQIRTLTLNTLNGGTHTIVWDGTNDIGKRVQSGLFFFRLQTKEGALQRKMVLLR
ncbi:MAG TPA: T9SS type A sorting domain-containing protein, partial [Bacteroidetes bacterium]|nr:T9SS type A sorting domain-containing protein [Bacteroidota bacterium]